MYKTPTKTKRGPRAGEVDCLVTFGGDPGECRALALLLLALVACGDPSSSRSTPPTCRSRRRRACRRRSSSSTPSASAREGTPDDSCTLMEHGIVVGAADVLYVTTDGESIFDFGAAPRLIDPSSGPNLYRAAPNQAPTLLYAGPRSDPDLLPVAASHGGLPSPSTTWRASAAARGHPLALRPARRSDRARPHAAAERGRCSCCRDRRAARGVEGIGRLDVRRAELIELSAADLHRRVLLSDDPAARTVDRRSMGIASSTPRWTMSTAGPSSPTHPRSSTRCSWTSRTPVPDRSGSTPPAAPLSGDRRRHGRLEGGGRRVQLRDARNSLAREPGATRMVSTAPQPGSIPLIGNRDVAFWGIDDMVFFLGDD